ncbi:hypothetical protein [Bacteroides caecimuris]|nr:hypothetical protein [Bacteroides caecimuris]UQA28647.1 hypothetical protein M2854_10435 [Bacteroides caecimuris]
MKKIAYIYTVLCAIVMVITVVNCKDEVLLESRLQTDMKDFSLEEAKNFFQTQARDNLMLSRSLDNKKNETVSPGDFVPNWDAAVGSVNNGLACYDIPITPTYHFKAIYVDERNGKPSAGKVNVYQKLVIVKDVKSNRMDQYILTLIPSQLYDSRNGSQTCNNFINCADKGGFTGVALYSCVYSQVTARISTYKNGVKTGGVFLLNASGKTNLSDKYEQARALASTVYIQKKKMVLTRGEDDYDYTYDGGWFDDIIIEPEPDYSEWGENDNEDWLNSSSPDTTPIDPEPTEPESTSQEDDTVTEKPTTDTGDEDPQLSTALKEITPLLKAKGIDLSKYKIQKNKDICTTTARTLLDGTIEVCSNFFKYKTPERASILWHEIYHCEHGHNNTNNASSPCDLILKPNKDISDALDCYLKWYCEQYANELLINLIKNEELHVYSIKDNPQWYKNEIETYKAELNNGFAKEDYYQKEIEYQIWRNEELLKYIESKK